MYKQYKRLMDGFSKGDLIRIKKTGETFVYETGGANWRSYLVVNVCGVLIDWDRSLLIDHVEKVNESGMTLDNFSGNAFES